MKRARRTSSVYQNRGWTRAAVSSASVATKTARATTNQRASAGTKAPRTSISENIPVLLQKHASPHEIGTKHLTSDQHVAQCLDLLCFVGDPRRGECIATK